MFRVPIVLAALCTVALLFEATVDASAADLTLLAPSSRPEGFEVRGGLFAHSPAFAECCSLDVNFEVLSPKPNLPIDPRYSFLIPRLQLGGMVNTVGKTSYAYGGVVWTWNVTPKIFLEPMFGGAIHNGELDTTDPSRVSLGCRELFHTGASAGYRLDDRWSVLFTWDHISNANACHRNIGLNTYGMKLGYSF